MELLNHGTPANVVGPPAPPRVRKVDTMKANLRARNQQEMNDEGVSPVIAVILMVAITVVLAATVYVWVSGFSSDQQGSENAQVRATGYDSDSNGATDYIRLTLVRGENAPYDKDVVDLEGLNHTNEALTTICNDIASSCTAFTSGETWDVGGVKYVQCDGDGPHQITLNIRDSVVLDDRVNCNQAAP